MIVTIHCRNTVPIIDELQIRIPHTIFYICNMKRLLFILTALMVTVGAHAQKPDIHILATGGTIAGKGTASNDTRYTAGQISIAQLIEAVPQINEIANITGEQIVNIGSQDMNDEVWLKLAERVNELLQDPETDGIVITHGTDTMEETAYFLSLTTGSDKPVVITGAMRASTAISADGPANIYNAVVAAADNGSAGMGVMVIMNGIIYNAKEVTKMNTLNVDAFQSPDAGAIGYIYNNKAIYNRKPLCSDAIFDIKGMERLPKVGIVYGHSNIDPDMVQHMLKDGYQGIVYAGVGNGNIHKDIFPVLEKARKKGIQVVRSSRVPTGPTTLNNEVDDDAYQFIAAQHHNPQKARILLMLALTKTDDWKDIQTYFNNN